MATPEISARLRALELGGEVDDFFVNPCTDRIDIATHEITGDLQCLRWLRREVGGNLQRFRLDIRFGNDLPDQSRCKRLLSGETLTRREQRKGSLMASDTRNEKAGGSFGHQCQIDERCLEQAAAGRNRQVAMQVQRHADADSQSIDAGDDGLSHAHQRVEEISSREPAFASRHGKSKKIGHIVAGREAPRRADKGDGAYVLVCIGGR